VGQADLDADGDLQHRALSIELLAEIALGAVLHGKPWPARDE
jgi:hypothetical protein